MCLLVMSNFTPPIFVVLFFIWISHEVFFFFPVCAESDDNRLSKWVTLMFKKHNSVASESLTSLRLRGSLCQSSLLIAFAVLFLPSE